MPKRDRDEPVVGSLMSGDDTNMLALGDVLNKIIHGTPVCVDVRDGQVWLRYRNNKIDSTEAWIHAEFSATDVLLKLEKTLHKHRNRNAEARERAIKSFMSTWRPEEFLGVANRREQQRPR
jgi:hypothetical protein